jgi:phage terminase large subunit GpA-like protein
MTMISCLMNVMYNRINTQLSVCNKIKANVKWRVDINSRTPFTQNFSSKYNTITRQGNYFYAPCECRCMVWSYRYVDKSIYGWERARRAHTRRFWWPCRGVDARRSPSREWDATSTARWGRLVRSASTMPWNQAILNIQCHHHHLACHELKKHLISHKLWGEDMPHLII